MEVGRTCIICGQMFYVYHVHDLRTICPECLKRLNQLLYPEKHN